ncbi:MAG: hypothetical protein ACRETT_13470 [Steroidobacteraceae bacterium]
MRTELRWLSRGAVVSLAVVVAMMFGLRVAHGHDRQHVSWDIINLAFTTPPTVTAGGVAFATTKNPTSLKIKLTGSGTFVAPASGGTSSAVKGGGTWETFSGCPSACVSTGSGTYRVTRLVSWEFDNFQLLVLNDLIAQNAANGTAVLRIRYSDGSKGILGIGCHGPGAHDGIVEGVIATKDFVTYWDAAVPVAGVNENRTVFHIE